MEKIKLRKAGPFPKPVAPAHAVGLEEIFQNQRLTDREIEVANLIVWEGLGAKDIARRLFISPLTVKDHTAHVFHKFAAKNRGEFMAIMINKISTIHFPHS